MTKMVWTERLDSQDLGLQVLLTVNYCFASPSPNPVVWVLSIHLQVALEVID